MLCRKYFTESVMEESLYDYEITVHQSLLHPIQFMGIGEMAFVIIAMFTTMLSTLISPWCIILGVIALLLLRFMCKDEPYLVDFIVQNLSQADKYGG